MPDDPFPEVPADRLSRGDWRLLKRTSETPFSMPTIRVEGHTLLYEQPALREAVRAAFEDGDLPWRFFFATRLSFVPPLVSAVGPLSPFPAVLAEARRAFRRELRERGFEDVERGRVRRIRTDAGERARLTKYAARFETGGVSAVVEAWLAVWIHEGEFRLAGGAYPASGLGSVALDPSSYREELIALIRGVR